MTVDRWATSKDVADRAGVSRAAVSAVFNGHRGTIRVSEATRERILAAAADLGYTPNPVARHLQQRRSGVVALAIPSFENGPYERTMPYQLSHHVMKVVVARGCQLIELALPTGPSDASSGLRSLREHKVDGVIVGWPEDSEQVSRICAIGVPVVQVMKPQPAEGTVTITVDHKEGMGRAVRHLTDLGHRRIAYLASGISHPAEQRRLDAFRGSMAERGLPAAPDLVLIADRFSLVEGQRLTERLMALPAPPTALIAGDGLVLGALRALYAGGIRVPDEFSVVCFDDELAGNLYPPLSSIRQPIADVARAAVDHIDGIARGSNADPTGSVVFPTGFIVRESTGPARRHTRGM